MTMARLIIGDVFDVLRSLPDGSVDLVLSSPPFLALRSYLPAGHPDKDKEIGSEPTPGEFIDTMLDVVEECRRVLAPHGSLCLELGDTYAGSGGAGGDYGPNGLREGQERFDGSASKAFGTSAEFRPKRDRWRSPRLADYADQRGNPDGMRDTTFSGANTRSGGGRGWPLDKSLCMVPELLRLSLAYGFNPLTGRETERWRVRNVVRWCRPNPPVGALADKVRPATSDLLIACTGRKRYFDLDAVRTPTARDYSQEKPTKPNREFDRTGAGRKSTVREAVADPAGAPPLDHWWHDEDDDVFGQDAWLLATEPVKLKHYATWPTDLLITPIEAMCPRKVCIVCGNPSERIVTTSYVDSNGRPAPGVSWSSGTGEGKGAHSLKTAVRTTTTTGWTDCGHGDGCRPTTWDRVLVPVLDEETGESVLTKSGKPKIKARRIVGDPGHCRDSSHWRPSVVLDPFAGSGTTLVVATGHGRDAIGIDLDERNADLARQRVGMFLDVETFVAEATK